MNIDLCRDRKGEMSIKGGGARRVNLPDLSYGGFLLNSIKQPLGGNSECERRG